MLTAIQAATSHMMVLATTGFDSKPNDSLPGGNVIQDLVGGLQTYGIYAAIAALVFGAVMIGWGNSSHNPQSASRGKLFLLGGVVGLILIGGVNGIGETFFKMGQSIN